MDYRIKSRIWIETDDHVFLGEGRIRSLKAIDQLGSLSKASKNLNISYKKAWRLIDAVNKTAKKPVTTSTIGGKGGGGLTLTPYGRDLIVAFDSINKKCWEFLDQQAIKINF